jgi:hypothetical protein
LASISCPDLAELLAFDRIEPIGRIRDDWQAALIANTIARCHGNEMAVEDFLLEFGPREVEQQSVEDMVAIMKRFAEQHNARVASRRS